MITEKERLQIKKEIECYIKKNDVLLTKELKIKLQEIYDSNQLIRNAKCTDLEYQKIKEEVSLAEYVNISQIKRKCRIIILQEIHTAQQTAQLK